MKRTGRKMGTLAVACFAGLLAPGPASAADIVVAHSEEKQTYDCDGGTAVINGGNNVLTLRNCTEVTVNGGDNLVHAGTVRAINILGSGNLTTTWGGPREPKVVNLGTRTRSARSARRSRRRERSAVPRRRGALDVTSARYRQRPGRKGVVTGAPTGAATVKGRRAAASGQGRTRPPP